MKMTKGMGVAMITPFKSDKSIDFKALELITNHIVNGGADYLVVLGTTGETVCLNTEEKEAVTSYITEVNDGRISIILGVGGNNTQQLVDSIRHINFDGIDGILSVAPSYNKPGQKGIYQHYKEIATASPVPIILYNVPGRTCSNISAETCLKLAWDFDNIIAIKEASGDFSQVMSIIKDKPEDFNVISGDDMLSLALISLGATGVISVLGNAFPTEWKEMIRLALSSKFKQANEINYKYFDLINLLFADGNPAGIKAVLNNLNLCQNFVRLPLTSVSRHVNQEIASTITNLDLGRSL